MSEILDNFSIVFSNYPTLYYCCSFVLGLMVGSFLNVVAFRLPVMMDREMREQCAEICGNNNEQAEPASSPEKFNLVVPRSRCGQCGHKIAAWENIPIVSYLFLKGKCSSCKSPISIQYPLVELTTGLLSAWVAFHYGVCWDTFWVLVVTWSLIAISIIDIKEMLIPDSISLPLLWLGLLVNISGTFATPTDAVIGAAAGYLTLWSVYHVFKLVTGKEGMGYGDFKLLAALGAWMGWQSLAAIILLSSFVGAIIGIVGIIALGRDRQIPIPFGPYLATAGWIYFLYGETIQAMYAAWLSG